MRIRFSRSSYPFTFSKSRGKVLLWPNIFNLNFYQIVISPRLLFFFDNETGTNIQNTNSFVSFPSKITIGGSNFWSAVADNTTVKCLFSHLEEQTTHSLTKHFEGFYIKKCCCFVLPTSGNEYFPILINLAASL